MRFIIGFPPVCRSPASVIPTNNKLANVRNARVGEGGGDRKVKEEISSKYLVVHERNQAIDQFAST